jgi:hypothetical protein
VKNRALSYLLVRRRDNQLAPTRGIFIKLDIYFSNSVEKIEVLIKSEENNGYFSWGRLYIYDNTVHGMSLISSKNGKCFRKSCVKIRNTFYV